MSCLTAWRLPESLGWPKKYKIGPTNMAYYTEKDLKPKDVRGKRFEIKAKQKSARKRPIFGWTPIQAVEVKLLGFLLQNIPLITKYLLPEKISLLTSLQAEMKEVGF